MSMNHKKGIFLSFVLLSVLIILEFFSVHMMWMGDDYLGGLIHAILAVIFLFLGIRAIQNAKKTLVEVKEDYNE